jgi:peroxiredoxin
MSIKTAVRGIFCGKRLETLPSGEPAPPISLKDTKGQLVTLEDALKNGPVVAAFFKVNCPTCQFTFPFLERLHETYGDKGFTVLGISQNDAAATREFSHEYSVKFPLLIDDESTFKASNEYGITNVPSVFLISPDGRIRDCAIGFAKRALENISKEAARAMNREPIPLFRPGEVIPETKPG